VKLWLLPVVLLGLGAVFVALSAWSNARRYVFVDGEVTCVTGRMRQGKSLFVVTRVLIPFCRQLSRAGGELVMPNGRVVRRVVTNFKFTPPYPGVEVRLVEADPDRGVTLFDAVHQLAVQLGRVEGPWLDAEEVMHVAGDPPEGVDRQPVLNALVILDEFHLYATSGRVTMNGTANWLMSMMGKLHAELWWITQNEMKVHKRVRDETGRFWMAQRIRGPLSWLIGSGWFRAAAFDSVGALQQYRNTVGTGREPRSVDRRFYRFTRKAVKLYNSYQLITPDVPIGAAGREVARDAASRASPVWGADVP